MPEGGRRGERSSEETEQWRRYQRQADSRVNSRERAGDDEAVRRDTKGV